MNRAPAVTLLDISLFGGLCVSHGDGKAVELPGRKDRASLGFLAATPDVPCPRDRLLRDTEPLRRNGFKFSLQG